jgi:hypothetical protein
MYEGGGKDQECVKALMKFRVKPSNDVKIFFKVAVPYLQKSDVRSTTH